MGQSSRVHVTLSPEAAEFVRSKISSGEFDSESAVIGRGLEALQYESEDLDRWERTILLPAYNRVLANSSPLMSVDELERHLNTKRKERSSAS